MTAKQITYTATYTTEGGQTVTATRTSHRPYTHAAVVDWGIEFPGTGIVIASFHSTEALARKGNLTGQQTAAGAKVIAAVPVTVVADADTPKGVTGLTDRQIARDLKSVKVIVTEAPMVEVPGLGISVPAPTGPAAISARIDEAHAAADVKKAAKAPKPRKAAKPQPETEDATPTTADIETAAAELAAESTPNADTAESTPTNGHAVVEFFNHLLDTGAMNAATARNHRGIFRSVISGGHVRGLNADVTKINAENVWDRYMGGNGRTLTDSTAKVYKQFYLRAIKLFTDYLADPQGFTPTGRSEARRTRTSHHEFPMADGTTLRVTTAAGADVKAALEAALESLNTEAAQNA